MRAQHFDYELIDCGRFRRLERFGDRIIERSCPQATWPMKSNTSPFIKGGIKGGFSATNDRLLHARFIRKPGQKSQWKKPAELSDTWSIKVGKNITAELRLSSQGQVGIFPEQFDNWQWINDIVTDVKTPKKILNAFAYTGMSTLFASTKYTTITHLDGAKSAISWAKRNAELSNMTDHKIRWICDDVLKFMAREVRRGNSYDGIILDPPAFGRGGKTDWKIERDLPELMKLTTQLLTNKPLFVILTCHAPKHFSPRDLAQMLTKIPQFSAQKAEQLRLRIPSTQGNSLVSSFGARVRR